MTRARIDIIGPCPYIHKQYMHEEVASALDVLQSSSPSSLLLASLDLTRHQFASVGGGGPHMLRRALRMSRFLKSSILRLTPDLELLQRVDGMAGGGGAGEGGGAVLGLDPLRVVIRTAKVCLCL